MVVVVGSGTGGLGGVDVLELEEADEEVDVVESLFRDGEMLGPVEMLGPGMLVDAMTVVPDPVLAETVGSGSRTLGYTLVAAVVVCGTSEG